MLWGVLLYFFSAVFVSCNMIKHIHLPLLFLKSIKYLFVVFLITSISKVFRDIILSVLSVGSNYILVILFRTSFVENFQVLRLRLVSPRNDLHFL